MPMHVMGRPPRSSNESKIAFVHPDIRRFRDLQLCLVLGHCFPQWWLNDSNYNQRIDQLLDATADERLPWEL